MYYVVFSNALFEDIHSNCVGKQVLLFSCIQFLHNLILRNVAKICFLPPLLLHDRGPYHTETSTLGLLCKSVDWFLYDRDLCDEKTIVLLNLYCNHHSTIFPISKVRCYNNMQYYYIHYKVFFDKPVP